MIYLRFKYESGFAQLEMSRRILQ